MQVGRIKERLVNIEQVVDDAAPASQPGGDVPDELRRYIDELEMRSCNEARTLDQRVQQAVTRVHGMISTLKHQLH